MTPRRLVLIAWSMFAASGIFFVVSGIRSGDMLTVAGSVVWLVGVALFLIAMARER